MIFKFWPWWPWKQPQNPPPLNSSTALNLQFPPFDFVRTSLHYTYFRPSSLWFQGEKRRCQSPKPPKSPKSPVSILPFCLNLLTLYVLSPQLLMIPRREKEVPRQYRFLRYTLRFFFSSSFRSFVRLKYSQEVILYESHVELFLWNIIKDLGRLGRLEFMNNLYL